MRLTTLAALTMTFALGACAGEEPAPLPPPPPPPPATAEAPPTPPPADPTPPAKPSMAEMMGQGMKGIFEAFNAHDAAKMATFVADDLVVQDYGTGETRGKAEFQDGMTQLFQMFPDAQIHSDRIWKKGNVVVSELTWGATMSNDLMGMKATKKPVGQMRLHITWFNDDGQIKEIHEYADEAGLMAQLEGKKFAPPAPAMPTNAPEMHGAGDSSEPDKLADWIKAEDALFNKDDPKAVLANCADDSDYWVNLGGPAMKGKKEMTAGLTALFKAFPDQKWTPTNAWGIDGFAIIEHTMSGTQKGPMGPIHATGKPVTDWHWVDIQQPTADGKLQHGWGYANMMEMLGQTGAMKAGGDRPAQRVLGGSAPKK